jgi:hypothetical protein
MNWAGVNSLAVNYPSAGHGNILYGPQTSKYQRAEIFCLLLPICPRQGIKEKKHCCPLVFRSLQPYIKFKISINLISQANGEIAT